MRKWPKLHAMKCTECERDYKTPVPEEHKDGMCTTCQAKKHPEKFIVI